MHKSFANPLIGATLTVATLFAPFAQASAVLLEQAPSPQANAAANGTDGQAPLLAENFVFEGTAHALAWWGTLHGGFQVDVYQGNTRVFATQTVSSTQAGFGIDIDDVPRDIYLYSIDIGSLAGGSYTLAVSDIGIDALLGSWYWLQGSGGDGQSISGLGERDQTVNPFDLSLRVLGERDATPVPAPPSWALLLASGLALWRRESTRVGR
jgi:hypothetical protein